MTPSNRVSPRSGASRPWIVFDFDGTIADTAAQVLDVAIRLAPEFGYPPPPPDARTRWRHIPIRDVLDELGIPTRRLPRMVRRFREEMGRDIERIAPVAGIPGVLRRLHGTGFPMAVFTTNAEANVHRFLAAHDLTVFRTVRSSTRMWGKARGLNGLRKRLAPGGGRMFYVGDETRDIQAARRAGLVSVAVTWGYNSRDVLAAERPDFIVDAPAGLLDVVNIERRGG